MLAHIVFFKLKDRSEARIADLIAASKKYLNPHAGVVFFAVGARNRDLARPVNDAEFDVALHVIFADRAAHDVYQEHPLHKQFIAEQQGHWEKVRVFDSDL